jgi:hypothetical protein
MSSGGIIIQRAKVLLIAVTDHCLYDALSPGTKAAVDAIDAKDPMSRDRWDVMRLLAAILEAIGC